MHSRLALIGGEEFSDGLKKSTPACWKTRAAPTAPRLSADLRRRRWRRSDRLLVQHGAREVHGFGRDRRDSARDRSGQRGRCALRAVDRGRRGDLFRRWLSACRDAHPAQYAGDDGLQDSRQRGVLIAGSSGGAMLLGARSEVVTPELAEEIVECGTVARRPTGIHR